MGWHWRLVTRSSYDEQRAACHEQPACLFRCISRCPDLRLFEIERRCPGSTPPGVPSSLRHRDGSVSPAARAIRFSGCAKTHTSHGPTACARGKVGRIVTDRSGSSGARAGSGYGDSNNMARNSRRDVTPSFAKILLRCHSTVRALINSSPAISAFV